VRVSAASSARSPPHGRTARPYTTFRIGGPADLFYEPTTADELARAVLAARELGIPFFLLGVGANILVATAASAGW